MKTLQPGSVIMTTQQFLEMYPERNAWYIDEIQKFTKTAPFISRVGMQAYVSVYLHNGDYYCHYGYTVNEALVTLYERLYPLKQQH